MYYTLSLRSSNEDEKRYTAKRPVEKSVVIPRGLNIRLLMTFGPSFLLILSNPAPAEHGMFV